MRCLQVVEPGLDGVFRHVEGLVNYLIHEGHDVALGFSSVRTSDRMYDLVAKVRSTKGLAQDLRVGSMPSLFDILAYWRLRRLAFLFQPEIIHAHSSKAGALSRLLSWSGVKCPVIYTPNAYFGMGNSRRVLASVFNRLEGALGGMGTTINVSRDEQNFANAQLGIPNDRLRLVYNGVDTEKFRPVELAQRAALRKKYGIPDSARVLGTVGRISLQKNYGVLYRAIVPHLQKRPDLWFLHIGSGVLDSEIGRLIDRAGVKGRIKRIEYLPDTRDLYQIMDGFALSSLYEGLSYAVLEALACDLPLVLSDAPGNRELLNMELSHCFSAPAHDVTKFEQAIECWLMGCTGDKRSNHRAAALKHFDLSVCCERIVAVYREILARDAEKAVSREALR